MITSSSAVEDHGLDALALRGFRGGFADARGVRDVGTRLLRGAFLARRGAGQRAAGPVVDELDVNVRVAESRDHARTFFRAGKLLANAEPAQLLQSFLGLRC